MLSEPSAKSTLKIAVGGLPGCPLLLQVCSYGMIEARHSVSSSAADLACGNDASLPDASRMKSKFPCRLLCCTAQPPQQNLDCLQATDSFAVHCRHNGEYVQTYGLMEQVLMDKVLTYLHHQQDSKQSFFLYYAPNAIHRCAVPGMVPATSSSSSRASKACCHINGSSVVAATATKCFACVDVPAEQQQSPQQ